MEKNVFNITFKQVIAYIKKYKGFGFLTAPAKENLERKDLLSVNVKTTNENLNSGSSGSSNIFGRDGDRISISTPADAAVPTPMEVDVGGHPIPVTHLAHVPGDYGGYRLIPHTDDALSTPMFKEMIDTLYREITNLARLTEASSSSMPTLVSAITDVVRELREPRVGPAAAMPLAAPVPVDARVPVAEPIPVIIPTPVIDASAIKVDANQIGKAIDAKEIGKAIDASLIRVEVPPIVVDMSKVKVEMDMTKGPPINVTVPVTIPPINLDWIAEKINTALVALNERLAIEDRLKASERERRVAPVERAMEPMEVYRQIRESRVATPAPAPAAVNVKFPTTMNVKIGEKIEIKNDTPLLVEDPKVFASLYDLNSSNVEMVNAVGKLTTDAVSKGQEIKAQVAASGKEMVNEMKLNTAANANIVAALNEVKVLLANVGNLRAADLQAIIERSAELMTTAASADYSSKINDVLVQIQALFQSLLNNVTEMNSSNRSTADIARESVVAPPPPPPGAGAAGVLSVVELQASVNELATNITLLTKALIEKAEAAARVPVVTAMDTTLPGPAPPAPDLPDMLNAFTDLKNSLPELFTKITITPANAIEATATLETLKKLETTMIKVGSAIEKGDDRMLGLVAAYNTLTENTKVELNQIKIDQNVNKTELLGLINAMKTNQDLITRDQRLIEELYTLSLSKDDQVAAAINQLNTGNNERYTAAIDNLTNQSNVTAANLAGAMNAMKELTVSNQTALNEIIQSAKLTTGERSDLINQLRALTEKSLEMKRNTAEPLMDDYMRQTRDELANIIQVLNNQSNLINDNFTDLSGKSETLKTALGQLATRDFEETAPALKSINEQLKKISKKVINTGIKTGALRSSTPNLDVSLIEQNTPSDALVPPSIDSRRSKIVSVEEEKDNRSRSPVNPIRKLVTPIVPEITATNISDPAADMNMVGVVQGNAKRSAAEAALREDLQGIDLDRRNPLNNRETRARANPRDINTLVDMNRVREEVIAREVQRRKATARYGNIYGEFANLHQNLVTTHTNVIDRLAALDKETSGLIAVGGASNIGGGTKSEALRNTTDGYLTSDGATVTRGKLNAQAGMIGATLTRQTALLHIMHTNQKANRSVISSLAEHLNVHATNVLSTSPANKALNKNSNCPSCGLKFDNNRTKLTLICNDYICSLCVEALGDAKCYVDWTHNTNENMLTKSLDYDEAVSIFARPKEKRQAIDVLASSASVAQGTTAQAQNVELGVPVNEANYGMKPKNVKGGGALEIDTAEMKYKTKLINMKAQLSKFMAESNAIISTAPPTNFSLNDDSIMKILKTNAKTTSALEVIQNLVTGFDYTTRNTVRADLKILYDTTSYFLEPNRDDSLSRNKQSAFNNAHRRLTGSLGGLIDVLNPLAFILDANNLTKPVANIPPLINSQYTKMVKNVKNEIKSRVLASPNDKSLYAEYLSKSTAPTHGISTSSSLAAKQSGSTGNICGKCNNNLGDEYYDITHKKSVATCKLCINHGVESYDTGYCVQCSREINNVTISVSADVIEKLTAQEKLIADVPQEYAADADTWKETTMMYLRGELTYDDYTNQGINPYLNSEQLSELKEAYRTSLTTSDYNASIASRAIAMEADPQPGPSVYAPPDADIASYSRLKKLNNGQTPVTDIINDNTKLTPRVPDVGGSRQPKFTTGLTGNPFKTQFEEAFDLRNNKGHMEEINRAIESQLNSQVVEFKIDPTKEEEQDTITQTYNDYKQFFINMDPEMLKSYIDRYAGPAPTKELTIDDDNPRAIEGGPSGHGISKHTVKGSGIDHVEHFAKMHNRFKPIPLSKRFAHIQNEKNNDISHHLPIAKGILQNHLNKISQRSSMNDIKLATNLSTIQRKPIRIATKPAAEINNCDHCGQSLYTKPFMVHKDQDTNPIKGGVICDTCFHSKTMLPNSRKRLTKEAYEPAIESNTNTARGILKKIHNKMIEPFKGASNELSSTSTLWNSFVSTIPSRYNADNVIKKCSTDILLSNNESVSDIDFDYYIIMLAYNTFTDQSNAILTANMFSIAYKYAQQHKIEYVKFVRVAFTKFHDFTVLKEYIKTFPQVALILIPHNE